MSNRTSRKRESMGRKRGAKHGIRNQMYRKKKSPVPTRTRATTNLGVLNPLPRVPLHVSTSHTCQPIPTPPPFCFFYNPSSVFSIFNLSLCRSTMADRHSGSGQTQRPPRPTPGSAFLRRLHDHAPNSTQFIGFLALIVSGCILLFLTGLTITATVIGLIFFTPLILLSSPIWVPAGTVLFLAAAGFLSMCGFGLAVLAGLSWIYKYFRGWNPPGSGRFDYARSRIADTASHVKDYAREYGGYLQSKVKDAAPGA